jgi:hypothetical protein
MPDVEEFSADAARAAAAEGRLADWVSEFLASPGSDNAELAVILGGRLRRWEGPLRLPLDRLHRLAGPPEAPVLCPMDDDDWGDDVDDIQDQVDDGWEPPPLVVSWRDGQLVLEDGNHRVEGLRRAGAEEALSVVGFETDEAHDRFLEEWEPIGDG